MNKWKYVWYDNKQYRINKGRYKTIDRAVDVFIKYMNKKKYRDEEWLHIFLDGKSIEDYVSECISKPLEIFSFCNYCGKRYIHVFGWSGKHISNVEDPNKCIDCPGVAKEPFRQISEEEQREHDKQSKIVENKNIAIFKI